MATTALQKITTRAKQIRKKSPGISWTSAVKKAGAEYRGGKVGAKKKKKVAGVVKKRVPRKKSARVGATHTTAQHLSMAKNGMKEQLAWMLLARDQAKTKAAKRKIGKKIAELKSKLRAL